MQPCLIVYYSRTGATAKVAEALALACEADLEALRPVRPHDGAGGYLRAAWEALRALQAPLEAPQRNPADYPFILLGTPVWAGHMSSPMRSYILQRRQHFRRVGLFCTMGGRGGEEVLKDMAALCNTTPLATLCLREHAVRAGDHSAQVSALARTLAQARQAQSVADTSTTPG